MHISSIADTPALPRGVSQVLEENNISGTPKKGSKRFWTNHEIETLARVYPQQGLEACVALLPGRTAGAIYNRAGIEGLKSPSAQRENVGAPRQRWHTDEHLDRRIRELMQRPKTSRDDIKRFAQAMGRPYRWVLARGAKLTNCKAPRFKELPWSAAELTILEQNGQRSDLTISRMLAKAGFRRTEVAVKVKAKRMRFDRVDPHHYTAHNFAGLLGVDGKTVTHWIEKGLLIAKRRGTARVEAQGGDHHWIDHTSAWHFIVENANLIDLRKVDRTWFIDFMAHTKR